MKLIPILALSLLAPLVARAEGVARYQLKVTAVACIFTAANEVEDCQIVSNPVKKEITLSLERLRVGDWVVDSKEISEIYELRAPQRNVELKVQADVSVIRDAGSVPAPEAGFTVGASIGTVPPAGVIRGHASASFENEKSFKIFHAAGERIRFPIEDGKSLEISPQIDITNLSIRE